MKESLAKLENFLLLFNPENKFELYHYWAVLEKLGFDPVIEYTKSMELFSSRYHPSPEDVFSIFLQFARFLKEFSDFENATTPVFRHSPIL